MPDEHDADRARDERVADAPQDDGEVSTPDPERDASDTKGLVPSSAPGSSFGDDVERTGGADAVPMTPADDGRAGRQDDEEAVTPPSPS